MLRASKLHYVVWSFPWNNNLVEKNINIQQALFFSFLKKASLKNEKDHYSKMVLTKVRLSIFLVLSWYGLTCKFGIIYLQYIIGCKIDDNDGDNDDDDELLLWHGWVTKDVTFIIISSRDHCQRSTSSRMSDTPQSGIEVAQNLSSGLNEWSCVLVITTTPRRRWTCAEPEFKLRWMKLCTSDN